MEVRKGSTNGRCVEERLELIEIDLVDTLSTEQGENQGRGLEGVASLGVPSASRERRCTAVIRDCLAQASTALDGAE
jgi:hypothetical protein